MSTRAAAPAPSAARSPRRRARVAAAPGPEAALTARWLAAAPAWVDCLDGERLEVIHRGVRGHGPGPDIRGAILATASGALLHGDVEVHRTAADWRAHGHAGDRRYAGVILHLLGAAPLRTTIEGVRCAVLPLAAAVGAAVPPGPPACDLLELANSGARWQRARERLEARSVALQRDAAARGWPDALWWRLLDVLGYSRNREPMRQLATALPLASLERRARRLAPGDATLARAAILLASAGLAATAVADPDRRVRAAAQLAAALTNHPPLADGWTHQGLRPANRPAARLLAAAALTPHLEVLPRTPGALVRLSRVEGRPSLGPDRAVQLVVNLVLPAVAARGGRVEATALADLRTAAIPGRVSRLAAALARQMPGFRVRNALDEQALLAHLERCCERTPCWACPQHG